MIFWCETEAEQPKMTALKKFERLEATGLWRPNIAEQRREVVVSLGDATLTITDIPGRVLAHWSLAAIVRLNGTALPAIFHPDGDPEETLELDASEAVMIDGIERLLKAIDRRRPRPGKLRLILGIAVVATVATATVLWVPGALQNYAVQVVPAVKRAEIGVALLGHMARVTGQPCMTTDARPPLRKLAGRVLGPNRTDSVIVLRSGVQQSTHLPGGIVLLNKSIIEDYEDPGVAAGFILSQDTKAKANDPLKDLLDHTGPIAAVQLITTGQLPDTALAGYAEYMLTVPDSGDDIDLLLAAFQKAGLRSTAYGYARDMTGETTLELIEGDPHTASDDKDLLSDGDWLRLQSICEE